MFSLENKAAQQPNERDKENERERKGDRGTVKDPLK